MTAAIYYHPEAYTTSGPKLMGRNAAGESFLRGFLSHSTASEFWAQVPRPEHAQHFSKAVRSAGRQEPSQGGGAQDNCRSPKRDSLGGNLLGDIRALQ